jgi:hypothetical protein
VSEWVITKHNGQTMNKRVPAKPSKPRRVGPGAVAKAAQRQVQLEHDLAKARRERIERAISGQFDVRATDGAAVDRLVVKTSEVVAPGTAIICDPPVRRASKQLPLDECEEPESYAKSVVCGPIIINGKPVARDQDDGGQHGGNAVRKLN